jgi:hypothetical protein
VAGAQVVIDLANSPSFEPKAVPEFFETSGRRRASAASVSTNGFGAHERKPEAWRRFLAMDLRTKSGNRR